jgi:fluoride ion exporter CrcB/FEX
MAYLEQGQWTLMISNVMANNVLCLIAAVVGMSLARVL